MAASQGEIVLKVNSGNFVNRIGSARRRMWYAIFASGVMTVVAIAGWIRPMKMVIAERAVTGMTTSDCMEYAESMCN